MNNILSKYEQDGINVEDLLVTEFSSKKIKCSKLWDLVSDICYNLHDNIYNIECSLKTPDGNYNDYDGSEEEFFDWLDQLRTDDNTVFTDVKVCITP